VPDYDWAVPPGGEGKITVRVKTAGKQGRLRDTVRVYSNDPTIKEMRLTISAFVKSPIYYSPASLLIKGKRGKPIERAVELRAGLDRPLELTPVYFNLENQLTYTIEEIEKGRRFRVLFKSKPDASSAFHGILNLKTNYPEKPQITLPIRGRIKEELGGKRN